MRLNVSVYIHVCSWTGVVPCFGFRKESGDLVLKAADGLTHSDMMGKYMLVLLLVGLLVAEVEPLLVKNKLSSIHAAKDIVKRSSGDIYRQHGLVAHIDELIALAEKANIGAK